MLAACAGSAPDRPPVADVPAAEPGRPVDAAPGSPRIGVVESASVVSLATLPASGGSTSGAGSTPTMAYRVQMPDGSTQSVVQAGERFQVGDRVRVTSEGRLVRP
jgi:hypothetical protein